MISRPSMFALDTLFASIVRLPASGLAIKYKSINHAPLLGQPKLFYPEHPLHLPFQSVGPFKLIVVVSNGVSAYTGDDPLVERDDLLREVRDFLGPFLAQILKSDDLFVQPLQLGLVSRSLSYQLLSKVQVVARWRSGDAGLPVGLGRAIHPIVDLTDATRSSECMFSTSKDAQCHFPQCASGA